MDQTDMGCCSCFGFLRKPRTLLHFRASDSFFSNDLLVSQHDGDDPDTIFYGGQDNDFLYQSDNGPQRPAKRSQEIILSRAQSGFVCRQVPVKETKKAICHEDENGNKMVNEYIHQRKIGSGSYGKVVLYRNTKDGKLYAVKVLHKSYMKKVSIMKMLDHPNIVNLIEVIDDPEIDKFYMVLEYVEQKLVCDNGLGETSSRKYLRAIISGLMYLHSHNIIHGDIKPDNLLVTINGNVKIGDFSVSQIFEDDDDTLRRSPGTPVFTAPECCQGLTYHGRAADTWAVGVTLYCMIFGQYPFLGDTLQETYDKIVNDTVEIPDGMNPQLVDLLERLLCKEVIYASWDGCIAEPRDRITLQGAAQHPWVVGDEGPIPEYWCRCGFGRRKQVQASEEQVQRQQGYLCKESAGLLV
uniref:Protein kinase domain-containing protein n=1 Tax=Leersia perrieri TaxID=77586 RepID=A0A0D9Y1X5_9ORYZ